jgi:hypothetical protein
VCPHYGEPRTFATKRESVHSKTVLKGAHPYKLYISGDLLDVSGLILHQFGSSKRAKTSGVGPPLLRIRSGEIPLLVLNVV